MSKNPVLMYVAGALVLLAIAIIILAPKTAGLAGVIFLSGIVCVGVMYLLAMAMSRPMERQAHNDQVANDPSARRRAYSASLIERSPVPSLLTGEDGEVLYANLAYLELFGLREGEERPLDILLREDEGVVAALYRLVRKASSGARHVEDVALSPAGRKALTGGGEGVVALRIEVRPILNGSRQLHWEIFKTAQPREPEAVSDAVPGREFDVPLDDLPGGVVVFDRQGRIHFANDRMKAWLGLDDSSLIQAAGAENGGSFVLAGDHLPLTTLADAAANGGKTVTAALRTTDGTVRRTRWQVRPYSGGAKGDSERFIGLVSEVPASPNGLPDAALESDLSPQDQLWHSGFFDEAPVGIALVKLDGTVERTNSAFHAGVTTADKVLKGKPLTEIIEPDDRPAVDALLKVLSDPQSGPPGSPVEVRFAGTKDRTAHLFARRIKRPGVRDQALIYLVETTEQKQLELQFAQAQKMQAVGQLAGGIAHDFNNVLTAVLGHCDLLLINHKVGDPSFADINQIRQNANRAANLVRQLLAFSRRQTLIPKVLSLTDALSETKNLLKRLLGEKIAFKIVHGKDLGLVKVDQGQLEQVIVNLAVNARDAMKDGGTLTISTQNVAKDDPLRIKYKSLDPKDYVMIEVSDTGDGIPKEVLAQIFEPFFTTKDVGEGTGLGLSTVYGIVKQTGGDIFAESEVGVGTSFRIFLPRHEAEAEAPSVSLAEPVRAADLSGAGTILLVEDEDAVRSFAVRALESRGYKVLEADNGETALEIMDEHPGEIDILVTDVVMPNMDGPTMVQKARFNQPDLKVIFISGYAEETFEKSMDRPDDFVFLPKPFSLKQLAQTVKDVLKG